MEKIKFFCKNGALMCEKHIEGLTQILKENTTKEYYGGSFFVCETISSTACKIISLALNGEFIENGKEDSR
jgi:hypothetical protein